MTVERDTASWVALVARELGTEPPTEEEMEVLLGLAGVSAHASERKAAPITCWLVGRAGVDPAEALRIATRLAGEPAASA